MSGENVVDAFVWNALVKVGEDVSDGWGKAVDEALDATAKLSTFYSHLQKSTLDDIGIFAKSAKQALNFGGVIEAYHSHGWQGAVSEIAGHYVGDKITTALTSEEFLTAVRTVVAGSEIIAEAAEGVGIVAVGAAAAPEIAVAGVIIGTVVFADKISTAVKSLAGQVLGVEDKTVSPPPAPYQLLDNGQPFKDSDGNDVTITVYPANGDRIYVFANGQTITTHQDQSYSVFDNTTNETYNYDENGNLLNASFEDGTQLSLGSNGSFNVTDSSGAQLISGTVANSASALSIAMTAGGVQMPAVQIDSNGIISTTDSAGQSIMVSTNANDGDATIAGSNGDTSEFVDNADGTSSINYTYQDGSSEVVTYDTQGNLTEDDWKNADGTYGAYTEKEDGSNETKTYAADGTLITDGIQNADESGSYYVRDPVSDIAQNFTFDANGHITSIETSGQHDGREIPTDVTFTYYGDGALESVTTVQDLGDRDIDANWCVFVFTYGESGALTGAYKALTLGASSPVFGIDEGFYEIDQFSNLTSGATVWSLVPGVTDTNGDYQSFEALATGDLLFDVSPGTSYVYPDYVFAGGVDASGHFKTEYSQGDIFVPIYSTFFVGDGVRYPDGHVGSGYLSHIVGYREQDPGSMVQDTYNYNGDGSFSLTDVNTAAGSTVSTTTIYDYNSNQQLISEDITNTDGSTVDYSFNASGQTTSSSQHHADGSTIYDTYNYNSDGSYQLTVVVTAAGASTPTITVYGYNSSQQLISKDITNADGSRSHQVKNPDGTGVFQKFDASGQIVESDTYTLTGYSGIQYSADGSYATYVSDISSTTPYLQYNYNASGQLTGELVTNADGSNAAYAFDTSARVTLSLFHNVDGSTTEDTYAYNTDGSYSLTIVTAAAGATTASTVVYEYNTSQQLISEDITNTDGSTVNYTFDSAGHVLSVDQDNADGSTAQDAYVYSPDSSYTLTVTNTAAGASTSTTTVYDYNTSQQLISENIANADGSTANYGYNTAGQITSIDQHGVDGSTTQDTYVYDPDSSYALTVINTAAGAGTSTTTVYDYNTSQQLISENIANADGSTANYGYNTAGQITSIDQHNTDGSAAQDAYSYNDDGSYSLTAVSTAAGASVSTTTVYGYDANQHLISEDITNLDGSTADYGFNGAGQVIDLSQTNPDGSTVTDTYKYGAFGAYTLQVVSTAANASSSTSTIYEYDAANHLRGEATTNPDGSSVTYLFDATGRLKSDAVLNADGSLSSSAYTYNNDGSYSLTVVSTASSGGGATTVDYGYGADGHLNSETVHSPDHSSAAYTFNTSGQIVGIDSQAADGTKTTDTYAYGTGGSYTLTAVSTVAGQTKSTEIVYDYDTNGGLTTEDVHNADGSTANYGFNAAGQIATIEQHGVDGSVSFDAYTYNADGSYSLVIDNLAGSGAAGTIAIYNYDTFGNFLSYSARTENSLTTTDDLGNSLTQYYGPNGALTQDAWQHADGSSGLDIFYANNASTGSVHNANGTSDTYVNDGHGDLTTTYFDATNAKTNDVWQKADGSNGVDTFNEDGSRSGSIVYADGSTGFVNDDGKGNAETDHYSLGGVLADDAWQYEDGSQGTDTYAADGVTLASDTYSGPDGTQTNIYAADGITVIYDTWTSSDGSSGTDQLEADGTHLTTRIDSQGNSEIAHYGANGLDMLSDHRESTDGAITDFTQLNYDTSVTTWSDSTGAYGYSVESGFDDVNGFHDRYFNYYGINDWNASDEAVFFDSDGHQSIVTSYASSETNGSVGLYEFNLPLTSDTNFGLDALHGITLTFTDDGDGQSVNDVSVSPSALLPYTSDTLQNYLAEPDPLAGVDNLIASDQAYAVLKGVSYSESPHLSGYITVSDYYHGVDGSIGQWSFNPESPIYSSSSGGSGGGSSGAGGSGSGGGFGSTLVELPNGQTVVHGNGFDIPLSDLYLFNSNGNSFTDQTTFGSPP